MTPPEICPQCGAAVPPNARACPECGSDERTGWSEDATLDRLGVPSEEFDYNEFVREEFGSEEARLRPRGISWFWWLIAILILLALFSLWVL
jgi:predicted nucleic acid-binding Zn ribbon protein